MFDNESEIYKKKKKLYYVFDYYTCIVFIFFFLPFYGTWCVPTSNHTNINELFYFNDILLGIIVFSVNYYCTQYDIGNSISFKQIFEYMIF